MKVALLAPASVVHTQRWADGLSARGVDVLLLTQHPAGDWRCGPRVAQQVLRFEGNGGYFLNALDVRRALRRFAPDVVNSHYASGYGTLGTLAGQRPHVISVWGSDVFDFPYQSRAAGALVRRNLRGADRVASTSLVMAEQVRRLVPQLGPIDITPFGVDSQLFRPREQAARGSDDIVIGTVKTMAPKYGIDVLIDAFARLLDAAALAGVRDRLRLLLVGDGPERPALEARCDALGLQGRVCFAGRVSHDQVPSWLHRLDVYVAASRLDSESFGVAVVEASSCGLPVVVSDAGGLPEVVRADVTGMVVRRNDPVALAAALQRFVLDAELRNRLGCAGRELVQREYEWSRCIDRMLDCYAGVVRDHDLRRGLVGAAR